MTRRQEGMTLAEVLVAVGLVGVLIFATTTVINGALRLSRHNEDRQFATQKAIAMLEELKALVEVTNGSSIVLLDGYDDAGLFRNVLTTQGNVLTADPASAVSGNKQLGNGTWLYSRQISVIRTAVTDVRIVRVRVYRTEDNGSRTLDAEVASVLRTLAVTFPPAQVYDVYCVAVENVPGWWVNLESLQPFVQSAMSNLQARNPGLEFRTHFITKLSYGRDKEYRPYINTLITNPSTSPINFVYFYPGRMPTSYTLRNGTTASSPINFYYPPQNFDSTMQNESGTVNAYSDTQNPFPYALADQYNHAMRYPEELALYNARRAANDGATPPSLLYPNEEPSLRLLLDDMVLNPNRYQNAIVLNLHGELFPFPPVRNYSDAAKDPESHQGWRVVTHPERITANNTSGINLRVYSYLTDPSNAAYADLMNVPITIKLKNISWTPAAGAIQAITGGYDFDNDTVRDPYAVVSAPQSDAVAPRKRMYYNVATSGSDTLIKLYNSPLRTTCTGTNCSTGGLDTSKRLYGLEYIPAPLENFGSITAVTPFSRNLTTPSVNTKNTARWRIAIPANVLPSDSLVTFETRIGDQITSGVLVPTRDDPANLSTTYVWRGTDGSVVATQNWLYGTSTTNPNFPMTERAQFLGDPRHCPYVDMKMAHSTDGGNIAAANVNADIGMGYNRYFDHFQSYRAAVAGPPVIPGSAAVNATLASVAGTVSSAGFNVTASNRVVTVRIDGGSAITVSLSTGNPRTPAQIVANLNGNATFAAAATAAVVGNRIYIRSNGSGTDASVQFVTGVPNGAETLLGFDGTIFYADWPGWTYSAGGVACGVNNNSIDPVTDAMTVPNPNWSAVHGLENDENRIFEVWRNALMRANAVYTTMTGFSYYYNGIGGEIGFDSANAFDDSIPISRRPFDGLDQPAGPNYFEQAILDDNSPSYCGTKYIVEGPATQDSWWGMPWLGELYPDSRYASNWMTTGNLPTGGGTAATSGVGTFRRVLRELAPPYLDASKWHTDGTLFQKTGRRTDRKGSAGFFWAGSPGATLHHISSGGTDAALQTAGTQIQNAYNQPIDNPALSNRPFTANNASPYTVNGTATGDNPDGFLQTVYQGSLQSGFIRAGSVTSEFYHSNQVAAASSGLLYLRDQNALRNTAFVVVNGLSQSAATGANFIANWSILSLMESFFWGGVYNDGGTAPNTTRIAQLPQLTITSPNTTTLLSDPNSITISWGTAWQRWDGRAYTPQYSATFAETTPIDYYVMYSRDNGVTWQYCNTDNPATPGTRGGTTDRQTGAALSPAWDVSNRAAFPQNAYLLRVEAYRRNIPLHYSYHQFRAFINR